MFAKFKRIGTIVVEESGVKTVWWLLASVLPSANQSLLEHYGYSVTEILPLWFPEPAWWWGVPVLVGWVIYSLASRILRHETPALELELVQDQRDKSWWLEVRNTGSKPLKDCAVDFERIENADGVRVFPHSFGLVRDDKLSNPFPLRATQPKQGRFATVKDGEIVIYGMTANRTITEIILVLEKYSVVVGAYSEADGAQCKKTFTLSRNDGQLNIS